jgi:glucokinase
LISPGTNTLAIDIGGTKFSVALFSGETMAARVTRATDRQGGKDWMLDQLAEVVSEWKRERRLDRCGIGFGGPVHFAEQRVALSTHVGGWSEFDLPGFVEKISGVRPVMDNDANAGALGELRYGAGQGRLPLLYITLSTGVGGGIVTDGGIYRGADSWAGEIGHVSIRPDGPECLCGARGCLERMCSGLWMERDHGKSGQELFTDPSFVKSYVENLALGLKAAVMLLNPARIVIGGGIAKAGDTLFLPLRAELKRQLTSWSQARVDVVPCGLADDSVLWGALALANS